MRFELLRHPVTLQQQSQTRDAIGGYTRTWSDVATVWASIEPAKGGEQWIGDTAVSEQPVRITIRYSPDVKSVDTTWRVKYVSGSPQVTRYFSVESAANSYERDEMIVLMCLESEKDDE